MIPTSRPLVVALAMLAAAVPAGLIAAPSAGAVHNCDVGQSFDVETHITRSSPLDGQLSATETVHRVTHEMDAGKTANPYANNVDAYVYKMACVAGGGLKYKVHDRTPGDFESDYAIKFYDERFKPVGHTHFDDPEDQRAQLAGWAPEGAAYAVVLLEEGPLVSGFTQDATPEPYSGKFQLEFFK